MEELCRVLKTGRHLAIMPYTRGVEKDLFIGGYSTAVKHTIPKRDYSSEAINELLEGQPHEIIGIHGINYFANMVEEIVRTFGITLTAHLPELTSRFSVRHNFSQGFKLNFNQGRICQFC